MSTEYSLNLAGRFHLYAVDPGAQSCLCSPPLSPELRHAWIGYSLQLESLGVFHGIGKQDTLVNGDHAFLHPRRAGMTTENRRMIPTNAPTHYSLPPAVLAETTAADTAAGCVPFYL